MIEWKRSTLAGLAAGAALGASLWAAEAFTGRRVYTLLLNIDYFPVLNRYRFPAAVEFGFHMIVAVALAVALAALARWQRWPKRARLARFVAVSGLLGACLWPTTALSSRTPAWSDAAAFALWVAGHLLYGAVLALLLRPNGREFRNS